MLKSRQTRRLSAECEVIIITIGVISNDILLIEISDIISVKLSKISKRATARNEMPSNRRGRLEEAYRRRQ